MNRISTGIAELDTLLDGGFPEGSSILVKGPPGGLKTIMALQFLQAGAAKGQRGAYVLFNQSVDGVLEQASQFGWEFPKLPVNFIEFNTYRDFDIEAGIVGAVKEGGASRLVVDSLSSFLSRPPIARESFEGDRLLESLRQMPNLGITEEMLVRSFTTRLLRRVAETRATALYVYEDGTLEGIRSTCEYLVDGVIRLAKLETTGKRTLTVEKMRYTKHDFLPRNMILTERGIRVEMR